MRIEFTYTELFNNWVFDTSAFSSLFEDMGKSIRTTKLSPTIDSYSFYESGSSNELRLYFTKSATITEQEFAIHSLDTVLGLIGGYSALLWAFVHYCLGDYEAFKFQNSILGTVYDATGADQKPPASYAAAKQSMRDNIAAVGKFDYSYAEFISAKLVRLCCCCKHINPFKKMLKRIENYEAAGEKFTAEMDVERILNAVRIAEFLSVLNLKKYQRVSTMHSQQYQIEEISPSFDKENAIDPSQMSVNADEPAASGPKQSEAQCKVLEALDYNFNPDENLADLLILYELTGFKKMDDPKSIEFFDAHIPTLDQLIPQASAQVLVAPDDEG